MTEGGVERPGHWEWLVPVGLTLIGAALRLTSPGLGSLWRDEGRFLSTTELPGAADIVRFLHYHESHPPLFYLLMHWWRALAGPSEAAAKVPGVVVSLAAIPVVYLIGRRAFGRGAALVAALIMAVAPGVVFWSVQIRPYALLSLLALWSCWRLWRVVERGGRPAAAGYVAATTAMLYTHNWALLIVGAQVLALLGALPSVPSADRARTIRRVAWPAGITALLYAPWLPALWYQTRHAGYPIAPDAFAGLRRLGGISWIIPAEVLLLALAAVVLVVALVRRDAEGRSASRLLLGGVGPIALVLAVAGSRTTNLVLQEPLVALVPFAALALADAMVRAANAGWAVGVAGLGGLSAAALAIGWVAGASLAKSNARDVADLLTRLARPGDVVLVVPGEFGSAFYRYYGGAAPELRYPSWDGPERLPRFDDRRAAAADAAALGAMADRLRGFRASGRRVWYVTRSGWRSSHQPDPSPSSGSLSEAGRYAAVTVAADLDSLYGPPDTLIVPQRPGLMVERLDVALYR